MEVTTAPTAKRSTPSSNSERPLYRRDACLSLVIPAWNEEESIQQAIREADVALQSMVSTFEIIVVDDGSTDRTAEIVRDAAVNYPAVRLVQLDENRGYSTALRRGFESARYELVAFTDADCQFDLNDLEYMLPLTDHYDIVSGYRIARKDSALRRFYSWGYNTLIQLLLGTSIRDVDCALKLFHREQLLTILPETEHFFANTEMLSEARTRGLSVVDVGVQHRPRAAGESKVSIRDVPKTLHTLLPYWWTHSVFAGSNAVTAKSKQHMWPALFILVFLSGFLLFRNLSFPLIEPDEGRYAEIPREMLASGQWVVPTLHNQPYLDKPPLFYWLCAGSYSLFGISAWAARLVPATASFLTILCTFLFGRRMLGTRPAFLAALVLALSLGFVLGGRFLVLDSLLTLFVTLSLFSAYEAIRHERLRWPWWVASAVCCGLGMLTKGPVAFVLLGPPVLAHLWLSRSGVHLGFKNCAAYVAVAAAVVTPWYAAITVHNPEFAYHFFWEHNVMRFFGSVSHSQPVWFYLPVVIVGWMPWSLLLFPLGLFLFSRSQTVRTVRPVYLGYCVLWSGWCLLFFSLSRGKLPPYILSAFPAMALLIGALLDYALRIPTANADWQKIPQFLLRNGTFALCFAGTMVSLAAYLLGLDSMGVSALIAGLWGVALIGLICLRRQLFPRQTLAVFSGVAFLIVLQSSHGLLPAWGQRYSVLPTTSPSIRQQLQDRTIPVACFGQDWGSVPFYLGRDDLHYYNSQTIGELGDLVRRQERVFLVLDHSIELAEIRDLLPPGATMATRSVNRKAKVLLLQSSGESDQSIRKSASRISQSGKTAPR